MDRGSLHNNTYVASLSVIWPNADIATGSHLNQQQNQYL